MQDLQHRFAAHWERRRYPRSPTPVLLALSGGVDSMVLAHLLLAADIPFAIAHCNFGLRGSESDGDAAFVAEWCNARGITAHIQAFNTAEYAAANKQSVQVAARELRYRWFEVLRSEHAYVAILTAHHTDDVAETVLMNLCRGTGIAGLHGIPEHTGAIIRPLLFASRAEITSFAVAENILWREDASNAIADYLRNALRHEIIPKLESLMPGAAMRIAETARRIGDAEAIYRGAVAKRLSRLMEQRDKDWYVPVNLFAKAEHLSAIAYEIFTPFGFPAGQIPHVLSLMQSESGRSVSSATHRVIRNRDFLVVTAAEQAAADLILIEEVPATVQTSEGSFAFSWAKPDVEMPDDDHTAFLHGDALQLPLTLRTRREGDYFYPLGMGGKKKKLKRFLIDIKMPLHEKDRVRILEWDRKILWIAGKRIDERFKLRPATIRVLKVVFSKAQ